MTEQQPSAPARAESGHPAHSAGGVEHVNEPHHDHFVVVGNHLAQHPELSLTAIGLAVHIQSLPARTSIGIKTLTAKFPEGEMRIAAALRELEAHGYLARTKERLQSGRVVTRTISYNKPGLAAVRAAAKPAPHRPAQPPAPAAPRSAIDLLAGLRAYDSRLLLAERDVQRLAPAVSAWLERGVPPTAVQRALTDGLPKDPIQNPAAFLAHRLEALLPPPLPAPARLPSPTSPIRPDPLQTCDGCDRAFRAPAPGRCRDCRTSLTAA